MHKYIVQVARDSYDEKLICARKPSEQQVAPLASVRIIYSITGCSQTRKGEIHIWTKNNEQRCQCKYMSRSSVVERKVQKTNFKVVCTCHSLICDKLVLAPKKNRNWTRRIEERNVEGEWREIGRKWDVEGNSDSVAWCLLQRTLERIYTSQR